MNKVDVRKAALVVAVIIVGLGASSGVVRANEINVNFDSSGSDIDVTALLKIAREDTAMLAQAALVPVPGQSNADKALPTAKELMVNIPKEDRISFLNSLVLKNGRIVAADTSALQQGARLKMDKVAVDPFSVSKDPGTADLMAFQPVRVSVLLQNLPAAVRDEFLENMTFKNGNFAAAYIGGLQSVLNDDALNRIILALAPKAETSRTLCGNGVCYDAGCFFHGCEESTIHSVCTSSCGN